MKENFKNNLETSIKDSRNDFLHKLSTKLIRENQTICLEDLNVNGMMKNHKLAKSIKVWIDSEYMLDEKRVNSARKYYLNFLESKYLQSQTE